MQQTTLLALQNQQGKNVNLCLLLLYLDSLDLSINTQQLNELTQVVSEFDTHVLQPLRAARSYLKTNQNTISDYATIRAELLSAELKLEKQQQCMLISTANGLKLKTSDTPNNIKLYV